MKIWFAASIPKTSFGGVKRSIVNLSEYLQTKGNQVKIIYSSKWDKGNYLLYSVKLGIMLLLNIWKQPDWIIARSTDGFFCSLLVKLLHLRTRVALYNHGWEEKVLEVEKRLPQNLINNPTGWTSYVLRLPLLRANLLLSDICICGTIEEARWIGKKYKSTNNKIRVIPNGIDVPEEPYWPGQNSFPLNFLMIGGFTWKKNLDYGLRLFEKIREREKEAKLYIVGTGKISDEKKRVIAESDESLVVKEVESPQNMTHWYKTCPFLLFPSRYEGGRAFSVLEAQAMGAVVFVSDIPSNREFICDQRNGIIISGTDTDEDCSRIKNVCFIQQKIKNIGVSAWENAKRHSKERQGNRLLRILD